jgi:hypothetical protein
MAKKVIGYMTDMEGGCGVNIFNSFELKDTTKKKRKPRRDKYGWFFDDWDSGKRSISEFKDPVFNTGYVVAAFINNDRCKAAYEDLSKHLKLVWQSDVRINRIHRSQFFFAVFDKGQ